MAKEYLQLVPSSSFKQASPQRTATYQSYSEIAAQTATALRHSDSPTYSGGEDFAALLETSLDVNAGFEGSVVSGIVLRIDDDFVIVDVGLKSEGRVPLREFAPVGAKPEVKPGDVFDLYIERYEDKDGSMILSREKARHEESWTLLEKSFEAQTRVNGVIHGRVKGGFTVDLGGATAFLPGSQVDIRPVRDVGPLIGVSQPFQILKMDRARGNIVVSRRAVLEETRAEQRSELILGLKEGQILDGVVKNITDYGAFVDLGGLDGLLHVTDIAWKRINHPAEALVIGQPVKVQVIRFNADTQRISLGIKQLEADPWEGVGAKYSPGVKASGRVTNITDYGAFVELEPGVEGLVHVSEMSWTKKNAHPGKIVSTSQEVDVIVLDVDASKRRISLGLKQVTRNPWEEFQDEHPIGSVLEGEVRNITEFGLFIAIGPEIDGMIHMSDISWEDSGELAIAKYNKGDNVKAKVLDIDVEEERISLGIKQLEADPAAGVLDKIHKGQIVTCIVTAVQANGIEVKVDDVVTGFIRRAELAREKGEQRSERFAVGDLVDAKITAVDQAARKLQLTIKGKEIDEDKSAVAEFGSSDSGASLGDILGAAIRRRNQLEPEDVLGRSTLKAESPYVGQKFADPLHLAEQERANVFNLAVQLSAQIDNGLIAKNSIIHYVDIPNGRSACLAVGHALFRNKKDQDGSTYLSLLHSVALEKNDREFIGEIMLLRAKNAALDNDPMEKNLLALEAAACFVEAGKRNRMNAALKLVSI